MKSIWITLIFSLLVTFSVAADAPPKIFRTQKLTVQVETLATGLDHPWSLAFLPNGGMLITERNGGLRLFTQEGLDPKTIKGLPQVEAYGQGGLLDVVLHPDFESNRQLYLAYVAKGKGGLGTEVVRGLLVDHQLQSLHSIVRAEPKTRGGRHFGGRMAFDRQGFLFLTLGDRGRREHAQNRADVIGTTLRLNEDGTVPQSNPFVTERNVDAAIYTYGHRNAQGLAVHPVTGDVWLHEHGPRGGDEINVLKAGANYGWPVITYGREYVGGKIGEGTHMAGMEQPLYHWTPSIAPSGMAFACGSALKPWQGDLFIGALKDQMLVRLEIEGQKVLHEERLFIGEFGRIRDVRCGPRGNLYLLTDASDGQLLRVSPHKP